MTSLEPEIWFLVRGGRRAGPFDRAGLLRELLALEAPEAALVWRSGLPAWTKAGAHEDLRRDLPPPVPGASLALPAVSGSLEPPLPEEDSPPQEPPPPEPPRTGPEGLGAPPPTPPLSDGDFAGGGGGPTSLPEDEDSRSRRRRKRRHRHQRATSLPGYAIPLALLFVAVMIGLWFLLRRMNEVPPGRIILQGAVSPGLLNDSRPAAIRA